MSSQTTNIHLVKPAYGETADVSVLNENMDLIDAAVAAKAAKGDAVKSISRSGKTFTATKADNRTFTFDVGIADSLTSNSQTDGLSARMGKALNDRLNEIAPASNVVQSYGEYPRVTAQFVNGVLSFVGYVNVNNYFILNIGDSGIQAYKYVNGEIAKSAAIATWQ